MQSYVRPPTSHTHTSQTILSPERLLFYQTSVWICFLSDLFESRLVGRWCSTQACQTLLMMDGMGSLFCFLFFTTKDNKKNVFCSFHFLSLGLKCVGHYLQLLLEFSVYCVGVRPFDFTSRRLPINSQAMLHILCLSRGLKSNTEAIICCDRNYNHNEK